MPPTVSPSIFKVGCPTPTGTPCPFLPHVPIPGSSCMSLPIIETFLRTSKPDPISVAPFIGLVILPFSILYASFAEKTNFPLVISTCPPAKDFA